MTPLTRPLVLLVLLLVAHDARAADADRPNVVVILLDDLGYGDLGCNNPEAKVRTPRLDALAAEGLRFTDAHAPGAVCHPSRYGLLTGRYPWRNDLDWRREPMIEDGRLTVPALLADAGYATAMVGKWHEGFVDGIDYDYDAPLRGGPVDRGFDSFFGMHASLDIPPYFFIRDDRAVAAPTLTIDDHYSDAPWTRIQGAFWRAGPIAPDFHHEQVLPRFVDEAVAALDRLAADPEGRPFFLYVALTAPHTPWLPPEAFDPDGEPAGLYGAFVRDVDAEAGRVLDAIDRNGLEGETLVIVTSDNGPVWYPSDAERTGHSAAGPLRGMKGDAWEGGHRMPFLVRWPGHAPAGATSDALLCFTDLMATFAALVGRDLPADAGEDSVDLLPLFRGESPDRPLREELVIESSRGLATVREGRWKLIDGLGSGGFSEPHRDQAEPGGPTGQLYDLEADPGEQRNLFRDRPEVVARLSERLDRARRAGRSRPAAP